MLSTYFHRYLNCMVEWLQRELLLYVCIFFCVNVTSVCLCRCRIFPHFVYEKNSKWQKKCFFSGLGLLTWHFVLLGRHKSFQSWIMNVLTYTTLGKVHNVMYLKSFKNATNIFAIKISRKKNLRKKVGTVFALPPPVTSIMVVLESDQK